MLFDANGDVAQTVRSVWKSFIAALGVACGICTVFAMTVLLPITDELEFDADVDNPHDFEVNC